MEQITVRNLTFSYANNEIFALHNISFSVSKGEVFLLIGESGCGKTTLLHHLKPVFVPAGKRNRDFEILFEGKPMAALTGREQASKIGYVRQNVEAMHVTDYVWHEIAFGLENLGYSTEKMHRRVAEMTAFFGLEQIYGKLLSDLSGGQKQLVNLASVMAMEPELLILDEPAAQLDPVARIRFYDMIRRIHKEFGTTIILTEHRLEDVLYMCDRVMVMEQGGILFVDEAKSTVYRLFKQNHIMYYTMPIPARLYLGLEEEKKQGGLSEKKSVKKEEPSYNGIVIDDIPLTAGEGKVYMEKCGSHVIQQNGLVKSGNGRLQSGKYNKSVNKLKKNGNRIETVLETGELWFRYSKESPDILRGCSISLCSGKITAVMGGNGTGKSTFLQVVARHLHPYSGLVKRVDGQIGILPQNPQVMFTKRTVEEELAESLKRNQEALEASHTDGLLEYVMDVFELNTKLNRHPFDLSGGEMQKLGMAKLILEGTDIFLLDEPEKGMDFIAKQRMGYILKQLTMRGKTVLMVSHDVEFCARYADMCCLFFEGRIISLADTDKFFQNNIFYTTVIQRMCKNVLPEAVLLEDVVKREVLPENIKVTHNKGMENEDSNKDIEDDGSLHKNNFEKANIMKSSYNKSVIAIIIFALIPATIYIGETVLQHRKYYFISMLLVLESIAAFFLEFEKRKPKLRQIMLVAMMTAITVAGRELFYMIPNIKPVAALVILSGVSFGCEAGFLIGSMSMLVSNIFFGQGPWTPWQMFGMGMLGFVAGLIFKQEGAISKKKKWGISIYGFLAVVLFYGVLMNLSSVIMYQDNISFTMIMAALGAGFPFDFIHGCGTFVFLMMGTTPLLSILSRVKAKYGFDF